MKRHSDQTEAEDLSVTDEASAGFCDAVLTIVFDRGMSARSPKHFLSRGCSSGIIPGPEKRLNK
jgi:hypothetical protein